MRIQRSAVPAKRSPNVPAKTRLEEAVRLTRPALSLVAAPNVFAQYGPAAASRSRASRPAAPAGTRARRTPPQAAASGSRLADVGIGPGLSRCRSTARHRDQRRLESCAVSLSETSKQNVVTEPHSRASTSLRGGGRSPNRLAPAGAVLGSRFRRVPRWRGPSISWRRSCLQGTRRRPSRSSSRASRRGVRADAARRHRLRQDVLGRQGDRGAEPADAGAVAQQDARGAALPGVQGVLPAQRGRVLRLRTTTITSPRRTCPPSDTFIEKETSINEEIDRLLRPAPRGR